MSFDYVNKTALSYYHSKTIASVSKTISNGTSSGGIKALIGGEYVSNITADEGYYISSVTVTMGGVDITESVFKGVEVGSQSGYVTASEVSAMIADALAEYGNSNT